VATPHLGASTEEAQVKVADQILQQMIEYFRKDVAINAVNFISVSEKIQPMIAPYFHLAQRLGTLFSQLRDSRLKEVSIRFYGNIIDLPLEPIASHLMTGALKTSHKTEDAHNVDFINVVNALAVAREKGVEIEIGKKDHPLKSHTNLIACDFITQSGKIHLEGTVYARDIYRLVTFGKYDVDADLAEKMVIIENDDVPGIIGKVGTLLAEDNINISHVSSGRVLADKTALNIFNVEGDWRSGLQQRLEAIENVRKVLLVEI
jgi:D-3-phosphoglycerate dehydrogenase